MTKAAEIKIVDTKGQPVKSLAIPKALQEQVIKPSLLHQVVVSYAANRRAGTAHTKSRAEVAGGGKKPWRQKGTGRARHGSIRSPLWVGGGVVFGPRQTKNYEQKIPDQLKSQAKKMVIADYLNSGKVIVVSEFPEEIKTKAYASMLKDLKVEKGRTLVLLTDEEKTKSRAFRNLPFLEVMAVRAFNTYDGLRFGRWLLSAKGVAELIKIVS